MAILAVCLAEPALAGPISYGPGESGNTVYASPKAVYSAGFPGLDKLHVGDEAVSTVPESSTMLLIGAGLVGLGVLRRR